MNDQFHDFSEKYDWKMRESGWPQWRELEYWRARWVPKILRVTPVCALIETRLGDGVYLRVIGAITRSLGRTIHG